MVFIIFIDLYSQIPDLMITLGYDEMHIWESILNSLIEDSLLLILSIESF